MVAPLTISVVAALNKWQSINLGKELITSKHCSLTDTGKIVALLHRKLGQDKRLWYTGAGGRGGVSKAIRAMPK